MTNMNIRGSSENLQNKVRCQLCNEVIESLTEDDFVWCSCGNIAVSGGLKWLKRNGADYAALDKYDELSKYEYDNPDSVEFM